MYLHVTSMKFILELELVTFTLKHQTGVVGLKL